MAMFPCITGIPTKLNSDMQAVLNKKMGTSGQTYPSQTWADEVNLMGKLPEKTVSGSIANFSDGADEVPLKSWEVTVDANLDGVSSVKATQAGKNLLPFVNYDGGAYNPAVGTTLNLVESATQFTKNGNAYSIDTTTSWKTFTVLAELKNGVGYHIKYMFSASGANLGRSNIFLDADFKVLATYNETLNPNTTNENLSIPTGAKYYCIVFTNRSTSVNTLTITEPQLEVGNSAGTYVAYTAPTVTTVPLGRTIYGGSADVVTGEGEDENGDPFTFTPITPTPDTALGVNNFWADEGDSEVTYRADIDLALSALGGRGLSMMRPVNTEEIEFEEGE